MKLTAPIYMLKQHAKALSRKEGIPLHQALDQVAQREGFKAWSLLSAKLKLETPAEKLLKQLQPGELVLLGGRPGQGKTRFSLELAACVLRRGVQAAFFTLEFTRGDVARLFGGLGEGLDGWPEAFLIDDSDGISADYMMDKLAFAPKGMLVVVDYLQLLDQKREHPPLGQQVQALKDFARVRGLIVVCLSQVDRRYDAAKQSYPGVSDVRLPNPVDLTLFDKKVFLNQGQMQIALGT